MPKLKNMKKKLIGLYELISGIFGVILLIASSVKKIDSVELFFQLLLGVLMFAGVAYAGNGLLNNKKRGVKHSKIAQAFQILAIQVSGMFYKFTGAAFLAITYTKTTGVKLLTSAQPIDYTISKIAQTDLKITLYILPIILLLLLLKEK